MSGSQALSCLSLLIFWLCTLGYVLVAADDDVSDFLPQVLVDATQGAWMPCDNVTLTCNIKPVSAVLWWSLNGVNFTDTDLMSLVSDNESEPGASTLHIPCVDFSHVGNYTCHAATDVESSAQDTYYLDLEIPAKVADSREARVIVGNETFLSCTFHGYPLSNFQWFKSDDPPEEPLTLISRESFANKTTVESRLVFDEALRKDNGSYLCEAQGPEGPVSRTVPLFVVDVPQIVSIDFATGVGERRIFLNWTVRDWNEPITRYSLQHMKKDSNQWIFYSQPVGGGNTSFIMENLEPTTEYLIRLTPTNAAGTGKHVDTDKYVPTLGSDPHFVPEAVVKGVTRNSITIGWSLPPPELKPHVHYYQLELREPHREAVEPALKNHFFFQNLQLATTYFFKVAACSEFTRQCGNYSVEVNGTTMDGQADPPENVSVSCTYDNISRTSVVKVVWAPPTRPNGQVIRYNIVLEGVATFKNEKGVVERVRWDRQMKSSDEKHRQTEFYNVIPPNTNYTLNVSAVTRTRSEGRPAVRHCTMPPAIPDRDKLARFFWGKVYEQGRWLLKLILPRVTERNGPICCYRVFLVRLKPQQSVSELPSPDEFPVSSYEEVHRDRNGGAYVAEVFESDALSSEVLLGDGHSLLVNNSACQYCVGLRPLPVSTTTPTAPTTLTPTPQSPEPDGTRARRSYQAPQPGNVLQPHDGTLDMDSNYTGFVEVIVFGPNNTLLPAYSGYLTALKPGPVTTSSLEEKPVLSVVLQVLFALIVVVLVLLTALCLLQRYTRQVAEAQGVEMTLTNSLRHLCRNFRGRHGVLVSWSPPDMSPLSRSDLTSAYLERHRDSDYGFQHEFELLPDRFSDRTTGHSEARENAHKNRYPDIKSYDQTRIRLSAVDGVPGSDYINANYVVGYKERKKFICAQGPMDSTVCDFWRMVWEQHLELVLMLTNLEEYSKTKCAKYWPDETDGEKVFGDICVRHVGERRYSDYVIRELTMTRSSAARKDDEVRTIVQYHFLVWKDFMAPEHPSGILKFIKRMNEAYSLEKGPILIHCSAGVGRTGTLVALDSLLQQLNDEGQVSIFNTICDLRHQRNFLVQSLKQYIFVYRALMEVAQFGDTELSAVELKSAVELLRRRENGRDKCKMDEEFEKITLIVEERKSFSVGGAEENRSKNRNELVIPYDRNRVILTPVPGREHTTYINASFVEGYDNSESFVITQDPLESTVADFWRTISEQNITTLVMLSDLGDGPKKCPRYWPDDETVHDHIRVKYIQSESCPYYTRRELGVTNTKTEETMLVTQYQYNGWPTVEGEVPEVTRGLLELVDQTQGEEQASPGLGPVGVHCHCGSDRSSMFVALAILVQQLRMEKRVDVSTTTRKLRSQRHGMIQTTAQYEFLHRAIVNYADLHHLSDRQPAEP